MRYNYRAFDPIEEGQLIRKNLRISADVTRDHDQTPKVGIFARDSSTEKREMIRMTLEEAKQFQGSLESAIKRAESEIEDG